MFRFVVGVALLSTLHSPALADGGFRTLAIAGDWVAGEHYGPIFGSHDLCVAMNVAGHVAFRTGIDGTELRVADDSWSLPSGAHGSMRVDVGYLHKSYDTNSVDGTSVGAPLKPDEVLELFAAMDHASALTFTVGNIKPRSVSLLGSTKVTNAYRNCAGIEGAGPDGGVNPFASQPEASPSGRARPLPPQQ